jgi:hypothetical protein
MTAENCPKGDDRNRTGVDGFAAFPKVRFLAYLSGSRGPTVLSGALRKRLIGQPNGQPVWPAGARALACCLGLGD